MWNYYPMHLLGNHGNTGRVCDDGLWEYISFLHNSYRVWYSLRRKNNVFDKKQRDKLAALSQEGYVKPEKWMRKVYGLPDRLITRYCYFELFMPVFFMSLAIINPAIYAFSGFDENVNRILVLLLLAFMFTDGIIFFFMHLFRTR